ncbi:hypothetical protein [Pseudomonas tussilaginis]|uniref:hypothetical protein n=1 Tax=Pseudomonas sp. 5 TaxID=1619949 RepID=UPI000698E8F9|nr:hypothetical protein [Pseudomonas sp. 5]
MALRSKLEQFRARITLTHVRIFGLGVLTLWIVGLVLYPKPLLIAFSIPLGILSMAALPLDLIPDHWCRLNRFVDLMISALFQVSLIFLGAVLAYELPGNNPDSRLGFLLCWIALQYIICRWIQRRIWRSQVRQRSGR